MPGLGKPLEEITSISVKTRSDSVGEVHNIPIYTGGNPYAPLSGSGLSRIVRQPSAEEIRYVASVYAGLSSAEFPQVVYL